MYKILSIDDNSEWQKDLAEMLKDDFQITQVVDVAELDNVLLNAVGDHFDLILLDLEFKKGTGEKQYGLDLTSILNKQLPFSPIVVVSVSDKAQDQENTYRSFAESFINKEEVLVPQQFREKIIDLIQNNNKAATTLSYIKHHVDTTEDIKFNEIENHPLVGQSLAMHPIKASIASASAYNTDAVLIVGETGTGKELIARYIYHNSTILNPNRKFFKVPISYLSPSFEEELFGSVLAANSKRTGLLERYKNDTILFDEIGDWDSKQQSALMQVLDSRKFRPIGGDDDIELNTQFIATTNQPISSILFKSDPNNNQQGIIRHELLHRFDQIILVPSVKNRMDDVPLLFQHFIDISEGDLPKKISKSVRDFLFEDYKWPGNVNEIKYVCKHFKSLLNRNPGKIITLVDLPITLKNKIEIKNKVLIEAKPKIYISCFFDDKDYQEQFLIHLKANKRLSEKVEITEDFLAGDDRTSKLKEQISQSNLFIFFVSAYLISTALFSEEAELILSKGKEPYVVIPIIIRPCTFNDISLFKDIQPFSYYSETSAHSKNDQKWFDVIATLQKVVNQRFSY